MKTVLVFGINGFIGKYFERFVTAHGLAGQYRFVGVDKTVDTQSGADFERVTCDCLDSGEVRRIVGTYRPEYVLNFIGIFSAERLESIYSVNVGIAKSIMDALLELEVPVEKVLLIGSAAEYGVGKRSPIREIEPPAPVTPYGLTKFLQSCLAAYYFSQFRLPVVIARTFNLCGTGASRELSVGNFERQIDAAADGDTILVGDLSNRRDFLDTGEAVEHYWTLLLKGGPGEIYNVCKGESVAIGDILGSMIEKSGKKLVVARDPTFKKQGDMSDIFGDPAKLLGLYGGL